MTVAEAVLAIGGTLLPPGIILWIIFGVIQTVRYGWELREIIVATVATVLTVGSFALLIVGIILSIE